MAGLTVIIDRLTMNKVQGALRLELLEFHGDGHCDG
jgi:hypothetical protein